MAAKDVFELTLTPRQLKAILKNADAVKDSVMIWGPPGIGKSQGALQYANEHYPLLGDNIGHINYLKGFINDTSTAEEDRKEAKRQLNLLESKCLNQDKNFIDIRLSTFEPSDLRGIPVPVQMHYDMNGRVIQQSKLHEHTDYITETVVVWAPQELLKLPKDWKGVIIFDEINSAMPAVQAASYQLILDRRIGELKLPDGALIIAAGNREQDGGATFNLVLPLRDRMTHFELRADLEQFIEDYAIPTGMSPEVIGFLKSSPQSFNTLGDSQEESHCGGSSPRSWDRVNDYTKRRHNMTNEIFRTTVAGRVGSGIAIAYEEYIRLVSVLPSLPDILNGTVKTIDKNLDESCKYFIAVGLAMNFIEIHNKLVRKEITKEQHTKFAHNYLSFLDNNFSERNKEMVLLAIISMTKAKVFISGKDVPVYKDIMERYQEDIRAARSVM